MRRPRGRQNLVGSAEFDTLAKSVLLEEAIYFNEELFSRDLKIHYNSQQENKEVQQTNLQAAFSTNQSIEHRENTNQNILVLFFSSSLTFSSITEFFFYSKLTSHKTSLSSFIWASIASLSCLTCP
jgi:hypothetical protein